MRIVYFGQQGSFAHEAALRAFPKATDYLPGIDSMGVLQALYAKKADCGVVPIENSSQGTISESVDALISQEFIESKNRIQEELMLPIQLHLLSNAPFKQIQKIYSNPVPMNYLNNWLTKNFPKAKRIHTVSTSEGAMLAAQEPSHSAAISNQAAAKIYGLKILRTRLEKKPNQTRFYVIASKTLSKKPAQRTAICFGLPHQPGALVRLLLIFANKKINLTRITSRPLGKRQKDFRPNEYVFWVDFEGDPSAAHIQNVLKEARLATSFLDVMGAYRIRRLN